MTPTIRAIQDRALAAAAQAANVRCTSIEGAALAEMAAGDRIAKLTPSRAFFEIVGRREGDESSALIIADIVNLLCTKKLVQRITTDAVELTALGKLVAARFEPEARRAGRHA
jgi:hypothetical protein